MSDVRVGLALDGRQAARSLGARARRVEALGFDSVWVNENVHSAIVHLDPFVTLAAVAAHTRAIRVGTAVALLPLRHPVELARTIASLDVVSDGRVDFGVGAGGGSPDGFAAYGVPFRERGSRSDEALEIITRLWTGEAVDWSGAHHRIDGYALGTVPVQVPRPPIWIGGAADPVLRRAARFADTFLPIRKTPEECVALYGRVRSLAREHGRDGGSITRAVYMYICMSGSAEDARRTAKGTLESRYNRSVDFLRPGSTAALGPPVACIDTIQRFVAAGAQHVVLDIACGDEEADEQMEVISAEVLPYLRTATAGSSQ